VWAKQSEAQLLTAEVGIMGADLEKLSPVVRSYYITMQRQILERRGVITPENNNEAQRLVCGFEELLYPILCVL
jgi:hypothetical protein